MFKNKSFNVKMIEDETPWPKAPKPRYYIAADEINIVVKQTAFTLALAVGGVIVAKNLSFALGSTVRDITWRVVDAKVPYPPISR